eukprot:2334121-Lingulodinium_polyedra.AAC.1
MPTLSVLYSSPKPRELEAGSSSPGLNRRVGPIHPLYGLPLPRGLPFGQLQHPARYNLDNLAPPVWSKNRPDPLLHLNHPCPTTPPHHMGHRQQHGLFVGRPQ